MLPTSATSRSSTCWNALSATPRRTPINTAHSASFWNGRAWTSRRNSFWPAATRGAGQHYGLLVPAAEALEHDHLVAATVLYRALLDDILTRARSPAYGHAARYLVKLGDLDTMDLAAGGLLGHEAYRAGLRRSHGRKTGFWALVESSAEGQRRGKHGH